jgi:cell wall-associated NlpC family hydrolase
VAKHRAAPKRRAVTRVRAAMRMSPVIAFARSQVGKTYRRGAEGPNAFDCSGFTKRAYALAGLRLPHSSGGQAARARVIPRAAARPGDLVVGPGHVGIYMGGGMMIDAGNSRIGVVYRRLYPGLHIERF